ncbi:TadE family protein [Streptomyces sp. M10(2022)]
MLTDDHHAESSLGDTQGRERDRGQTAIEFLGVTPLIILLLVALWQCALIGYTFSLAGNAADQGARAGTGAPFSREQACVRAAEQDLPGAWASAAGPAAARSPGCTGPRSTCGCRS